MIIKINNEPVEFHKIQHVYWADMSAVVLLSNEHRLHFLFPSEDGLEAIRTSDAVMPCEIPFTEEWVNVFVKHEEEAKREMKPIAQIVEGNRSWSVFPSNFKGKINFCAAAVDNETGEYGFIVSSLRVTFMPIMSKDGTPPEFPKHYPIDNTQENLDAFGVIFQKKFEVLS